MGLGPGRFRKNLPPFWKNLNRLFPTRQKVRGYQYLFRDIGYKRQAQTRNEFITMLTEFVKF